MGIRACVQLFIFLHRKDFLVALIDKALPKHCSLYNVYSLFSTHALLPRRKRIYFCTPIIYFQLIFTNTTNLHHVSHKTVFKQLTKVSEPIKRRKRDFLAHILLASSKNFTQTHWGNDCQKYLTRLTF